MSIVTVNLPPGSNLKHPQNSLVIVAKASFTAAIGFLLMVTLLHFLKSDLDPSWRMISEYAIGPGGWIMRAAFISWAVSYAALFFSIRSDAKDLPGRIGLGFLILSALSVVIAGIFITDPITAGKDDVTMSGTLHNAGGTLAMAMPFAIIFTSWSLYKNPEWKTARRRILWSAVLAVIGFFIAAISLAVLFSKSSGVAGPHVPVGYPLRFETLTYCIWLMVVSKQAINLKGGIKELTRLV